MILWIPGPFVNDFEMYRLSASNIRIPVNYKLIKKTHKKKVTI